MKPALRFALPCLLLLAVCRATPAEDAVVAAEQSRRAALLAGDAPALAALLADDLTYIHSSGKRETKADAVSGIASRKVAYERFDLDQLKTQIVTEDVVVLTGAIDQRKFSGGKWTDLKLLFHAVWRREAGAWRLASLQTAQPPPPKA